MNLKLSNKWVISLGVTLGLLLLLQVIGAAAKQGPELSGNEQPQAGSSIAANVNPRISYQGVLKEDGQPVTGSRDMVFRFYSDAACNEPVGDGVSRPGVPVTDGLFNVELDVDPAYFDGQGRWLRVEVAGTPIGCEEVLPTPYALSLRPGAVIQGDVASPSAVLNAHENSTGWGVYGSGGTIGVRGSAYMSGTTTYGVYGESVGDIGAGVYGSGRQYGVRGDGYYYGVYGQSDYAYGTGVRGRATQTTGYNYGVYGQSDSTNGRGVYGYSPVYTGTTVGVYGLSYSNDGFGVAGHNYYGGVGVGAWSYSGNLIEAYDGDFPGGTLRFSVNNAGDMWASGYKSALVDVAEYGHRLLYAVESPEVWFEDFGTATLVDGQVIVEIEPLFAKTVNLEVDYHVFLTPLGDCQGLYVAAKTPTSFEVRELGGGDAGVSFDYRIVAKRLGYEDQRLEEVILPESTDPARDDRE